MNDKPATGPSIKTVPEGDNRTRLVCPDCGYIEYDNPKIVVGAVCTWEDRLLLCRRAIEPRKGLWTFPAGFMELGESMAEGAAREVWEEACARVVVEGLIGIYEVPRVSHVYAIYQARMTSPEYAPGAESEAVDLFERDRIPWGDLAFPSIVWGLERSQEGGGPYVHVAHPPTDSV